MDTNLSINKIALDITPILLSAFLDAFRQKRNTSSSAMQDVSRMAEFGIFVYLSKIIGNIKEKAVSAYLETLCKLLKELLQWNVYSARNDDIAKSQQDVLNSIAEDVVSYLGDSKSMFILSRLLIIISKTKPIVSN